ncbi:response regulator [bacterium]|nr:response regulator [bacterium]
MPSPKARVLIVDDEKDNLNALKRLLRNDFEVEVASSGPEALKILDASPNFECILSDQRMPGMNGSELFERIKDINPFATRILISGFSDLEAVIEAVNRGHIWKYIGKPWEPAELIETLKTATERAQLTINLDRSRYELKRAALELSAKDWARERLLQILLHEFRSIPQILDSVINLNSSAENTEDRLRFLNRAKSRISVLSCDIETLLEDEKQISIQTKQPIDLIILLEEVLAEAQLSFKAHPETMQFIGSVETIKEGLLHLLKLMKENQANASLEVEIESVDLGSSQLFLTISAKANEIIYPAFADKKEVAAEIAWKAALEPFVGHESILLHKDGLRIDTARHIRRLSAQGIRVDVTSTSEGKEVVMTIRFATSA